MHCPAVEPSPERLQRLNALAAEHLAGWRWMRPISVPRRYLMPPDVMAGVVSYETPIWEPASGTEADAGVIRDLPDYAHDLDACATLEAIVVSRGHGSRYAAELQRWAEQQEAGTRMLAFATAPAWVRLEACLRVCNVEVEKA